MRPLRKGAARTGLAEGLAKLAGHGQPEPTHPMFSQLAQRQAAVLGGAIEAALDEQHQGMNPRFLAEFKRDFWRIANENLWRLTRALEASRLLDKAGE